MIKSFRKLYADRIRRLAAQRVRDAMKDERAELRRTGRKCSPSIFRTDARMMKTIAANIVAGRFDLIRRSLRRMDTEPKEAILIKLGKRFSRKLGWELR